MKIFSFKKTKLHYTGLAFFVIATQVSCAQQNEEEIADKVIYAACTEIKEQAGVCSRFMDRDIYLAYPFDGRNNTFDINLIKGALNEISTNSYFGSSYFRYFFVNESELTITPIESTSIKHKSNIQVWPDDEFNQLWSGTGPHLDPNAILLVNFANKKEFSIVFRGSCFEVNNFSCTSNPNNNFTQNKGLYALVGRTIARALGALIKSCSESPNDAMCGEFPHDGQWNNYQRNVFFSDLMAAQSSVASNLDFYDF